MKKRFINALVAVGLLATLNSCSKDEQVEKTTTSATQETSGSSASLGANISLYTTVNKDYLQTTPMLLDKYTKTKNWIQPKDTVCNKELTIRFIDHGYPTWGRIVKDTTNWGNKPYVTDESPILIAFDRGTTSELVIRLSKKVTEFGLEYYMKYFGYEYTVTQTIWDTKTQTKIGTGLVLKLDQILPNNTARFGKPRGTALFGIKSDVPFDEIRMTVGRTKEVPVIRYVPHFIGNMRYKLAK